MSGCSLLGCPHHPPVPSGGPGLELGLFLHARPQPGLLLCWVQFSQESPGEQTQQPWLGPRFPSPAPWLSQEMLPTARGWRRPLTCSRASSTGGLRWPREKSATEAWWGQSAAACAHGSGVLLEVGRPVSKHYKVQSTRDSKYKLLQSLILRGQQRLLQMYNV